jgi:hypothetical protein
MEPRRDDLDLAAELRALRPAPRPEFAAELDRRAEAGFPQRGGGSPSLFERAAARLPATSPRRLLAPVGAFAAVALVIATAIIAVSDHGANPSLSLRSKVRNQIASPVNPAEVATGTGRLSRPAGAEVESQSSYTGNAGRYAAHASHRDIERSSQIVLSADPADVRSDAAKVFDAVHAADGIVLRSSIRDGAAGEAGAYFDLLIPSGKVGDALASFSSIAEVRSRHESTQDITAPTIRIGERLQDSRARIEGLLAQLAMTTTDAERTAVEAELRAERARAAALRSRLSDLSRRANLTRVSLRIETGESSGSGSTGGAWGIGDGLHSAGRILAIAAGVAVVGLAIIAPLALICLLAWLLRRTWIRTRREQALSRRV